MSKRLCMMVATGSILALATGAGAGEPFTALFGLATAPNGNLLAADAAAGIIPIGPGNGKSIAVEGSARDASPIGTRSMWVVTGAATEDGTFDSGQALHRASVGTPRKVANLFAFEAAVNPDGGIAESNPFDVQSLGGRGALVADAAANDLLLVNNQGAVDVVAVFPNEVVSTANIMELANCPDPPEGLEFICELPPAIPAQPVPTSIALGGGHIFVGELKGFPAPTDESNIWKISPGASWAQCGASPDCVKAFDGGFTSIIDLAWGPDGLLYVLELDEASWFALEIGGTLGGTVNACDVSSGVCEVVAERIPIPTALAFGKDGSLWATRNALIPGLAEVFEVP